VGPFAIMPGEIACPARGGEFAPLLARALLDSGRCGHVGEATAKAA
jgi:hypothetical protein